MPFTSVVPARPANKVRWERYRKRSVCLTEHVREGRGSGELSDRGTHHCRRHSKYVRREDLEHFGSPSFS